MGKEITLEEAIKTIDALNKKIEEKDKVIAEQAEQLVELNKALAEAENRKVSEDTIVKIGKESYKVTIPSFRHPETGEIVKAADLAKNKELCELILKLDETVLVKVKS